MSHQILIHSLSNIYYTKSKLFCVQEEICLQTLSLGNGMGHVSLGENILVHFFSGQNLHVYFSFSSFIVVKELFRTKAVKPPITMFKH